jgi:hypothetical protein
MIAGTTLVILFFRYKYFCDGETTTTSITADLLTLCVSLSSFSALLHFTLIVSIIHPLPPTHNPSRLFGSSSFSLPLSSIRSSAIEADFNFISPHKPTSNITAVPLHSSPVFSSLRTRSSDPFMCLLLLITHTACCASLILLRHFSILNATCVQCFLLSFCLCLSLSYFFFYKTTRHLQHQQ